MPTSKRICLPLLFRTTRAEVLHKEGKSFESQAFTRFRRLESMNVVDGHKLHRNSGLIQFVGEFLGLRKGHFHVLSPMDDKEWRIIFGDVERGRGVLPNFRAMGVVPAEKVSENGIAIRLAMHSEVGWPANIDHRLHTAGIFGEGWVGIVSRIFHPEQSGQLRARGMPECADMLWIDSVFCRVGANPAHRTLHVIQLRRPAVFASMQQTVIDSESDKTAASKKHSHGVHGRFVKTHPAAAMDQKYRGLQ